VVKKKILIYGLVSSENLNEIKYVGKTYQNIKKRIHDHIRESKKLKTKKDIWIQETLDKNLKIEYKIIEECDESNWLIREKYWIKKLKKLTNISKGGDGGRGLLATKTYDELKDFVSKSANNVKNSKEWINFVINNPEFNFLPKYPSASYKNRGWISWSDFLINYKGVDSYRRNAFKYIFTYNEAKEFLSTLNIKNCKEFKKIIKSLDSRVPSSPDEYYKKRNSWINWSDFLSNKNIYHKNKNFLNYNVAKNILKIYNLKSANEYQNFIKKNKNYMLPFNADKFYKKRNVWLGWSDFLNYKNVK
jgi:hypothetical protein